MPLKIQCPRCNNTKLWRLKTGKVRCSVCRYDWVPGQLPLHLTRNQWLRLLHLFLKEISAARIAQETGLGREQVLRALFLVRQAMACQVSLLFSGTIMADPPDIKVVERDMHQPKSDPDTNNCLGTAKIFVFGILYSDGQVWLVEAPQKRQKSPVNNQDPVPENLYDYLQHKLGVKRGIRRERRPFYLAEFTWRYNHCHLTIEQQSKELLNVLQNRVGGHNKT